MSEKPTVESAKQPTSLESAEEFAIRTCNAEHHANPHLLCTVCDIVAEELAARDAAIRAEGVREGVAFAAHLVELLSQDDRSARRAAKRIRAAAKEVKP